MRACALLLVSTAVCAQPVRFGVKAGVPLTRYFDTGTRGGAEYSAATRRYTVGASVEWLWLELDVLYKRMGYVGIITSESGARSAIDTKGNSWEFPVLIRRRLPGRARPFVGGGGVLRYIGPIRGRGEFTAGGVTTPIDTTDPVEVRKRLYPGISAAAGIEMGRLVPEFRYTRWTANLGASGDPLRFTPNQAEVLLGLVF